MESNGNFTEDVKPIGEQPENEKKRQIDDPDTQEPEQATKKVKTEDGSEVAVDAETIKTEVKHLPKGTAPIKPE